MRKNHLLFLIILLEGYVVLACELLAIRQLIPFVGSGTEVIAIIISGVLLPLAVGYYIGGNASKRSSQPSANQSNIQSNNQSNLRPNGFLSIRKILLKNIFSALLILMLGLSYSFLEVYFNGMRIFGFSNRLLQTAIYSAIFLAIPVLYLGQTVPLISNYFSAKKLSVITGKMLFFSTAGSFLGSVFTTIVLMSTIGVHNTVVVTLGFLCLLGLLLSRKKMDYANFIGIFILVAILNNGFILHKYYQVVANNAYNMVKVVQEPQDESVILNVNRSNSSKLSKDPNKRFAYINYIEKIFIDPISKPEGKARDILVIGAGGFTIGLNDSINHYTYVDIDKTLKDISEKYFLQKKLLPNKQFIAASARAFVHNDAKKYDLIILDTYTNVRSIPMECITRDFLQDVKALLKKDGMVVANIISAPDFRDKFTVRYDNTFSEVFPLHTRQVATAFNPWDSSDQYNTNVLYIYYNNNLVHDAAVYTDDKNTYSLDRP